MGRGGKLEPGSWARVRPDGDRLTAGSWVLVDTVSADGKLRATMFGDDGSAQLRGLSFRVTDVEPATPPWV